MEPKTTYKGVLGMCQEIFLKKNKEYGQSWTLYRPSSMTDKILIKAKRIRTLQETKQNLVGDPVKDEFLAIVNYSITALIIMNADSKKYSTEQLLSEYDRHVKEIGELMEKKNHDYGGAWRDMRISSMTDEILVKLARIITIENSLEETRDKENLASNFQDIVNYAVFCLIKIEEGEDPLK